MNINDGPESPEENVGIFSSNFPTFYYEVNQGLEALSFITESLDAQGETPTTPAVEASYFDTGWLKSNFKNRFLQNNDGDRFEGLPIIGFGVQQYINSNLTGSVLANYAGIFEHKSDYSSYQNNNNQEDQKSGMQIASDNLGQVLLFPYYTVNNGMNTLISLVNTTDQTKALKVRFLEGKNSRTCLDFNVYLSPYDVWTSALVAHEATSLFSPGHEGEPTVRLLTSDNSCVDPSTVRTAGFEFLPYAFTDTLDDGLGNNLERCREGHIQVIDMGDITDAVTIAGIDHGSISFPSDCGVVVDNVIDTGGIWNDPENITGIDVSSGGMYGSVSLIDVARGIDLTYDATALIAFTTQELYENPSSLEPNLSSGNVMNTLIDTPDGSIETTWQSPIDAVTALFMQAQTINDFVISPFIGAQTEWVNTFPTKKFYVDPLFSNSALALAPFNTALIPDFGACDYHRFNAYNRDQQLNTRTTPAPVHIFLPTSLNFNIFPGYCWSVNVSKVQDGTSTDSIFDSKLSASDFFSDPLYSSISEMPFTEGWLELNHNDGIDSPGKLVGTGPNGEIHEFYGKPILGFSAQKYVNGALGDEHNQVLANYGLINKNKIKKKIVISNNK
ncbi:MAG: hypothetical protein L3J83_10595 [Proteobacteria bacterium]|nr:hypothetical protein [Pseudomonadota bacterium]